MLTLKVILFMYVLFACNKMKNKEKHHTVGTFPKSNRTIVKRGKIGTLFTPLTFLACYRHFNKKLGGKIIIKYAKLTYSNEHT